MDGFTYHDIFQTKGIEYIIIITFLLLLVPFWILINKKEAVSQFIKSTVNMLTFDVLRIPKGVLFNKNHTWAHLKKSGIAEVGIDDWILHLTGEINLAAMKNSDENISKGDIIAVIENNGKELKLTSPISGKIMSANYSLLEDSKALVENPYLDGWLYQVEPTNWKAETSALVLGEDAGAWFMKELQRFKDFMAISLAKLSPEMPMAVFQEGGELFDHPLQELPPEIWSDFQKEFLND